jgi:hypothetical protein
MALFRYCDESNEQNAGLFNLKALIRCHLVHPLYHAVLWISLTDDETTQVLIHGNIYVEALPQTWPWEFRIYVRIEYLKGVLGDVLSLHTLCVYLKSRRGEHAITPLSRVYTEPSILRCSQFRSRSAAWIMVEKWH